MTAPTPIQATLSRCRHGHALVVLDGQPFNGLEIRPGALRVMAQQLNALADMAARLPTGGKHWRPTQVQMASLATDAATAQEARA
ncbi:MULTISPECIES: hypothetical protein [unclassified Polaromonas]|jgi:hypothetical protein|uniref:hypothetical protein n=1 Tax=unclassified Polaromonas TaxID=2638319 RepID=UPI000BD7C3D0|nr:MULTISPECIES: hypothetical protein [unclassified Polaromonas]OYY37081.1 MAG: hypothetical protein B7Y60_08905 [Polaromonas sp. 35-63-35]OYZ78837.1 MAG: hypothetical protein B7Y09_11170 [Polaromonas sp. 24-63-21]OZA86807.1 MAG: hypothetical protein B7X65_15160 [Polaromonas sp. 39-63-25]HQR97600.1 hypothetical protein [Polaromonas sp.]HQS40094.1 hypothetical protein [Polaromonas sp.]